MQSNLFEIELCLKSLYFLHSTSCSSGQRTTNLAITDSQAIKISTQKMEGGRRAEEGQQIEQI
jgi:hypothetical protein